jgi:hypothetical protein
VATTSRPAASMASGGSRAPTRSAVRASGAARPATASPRADGSRLIASTRCSRDAALAQALQGPCRRRARVRTAQA